MIEARLTDVIRAELAMVGERGGREGPPRAQVSFWSRTRAALPAEVAQVEEAGAADDAAAHDFDLVDARRVDEELTLHADVEAHLAHGERAACTSAVALQHDALEDLNAILVAFDDLVVNANGVTDPEVRGAFTELLFFDLGDLRVLHGGGGLKAFGPRGVNAPLSYEPC